MKSVCRIEEELITGEIPWKFSYGTAGFRDKSVAIVFLNCSFEHAEHPVALCCQWNLLSPVPGLTNWRELFLEWAC